MISDNGASLTRAMVLAAGLGLRMRPLTLTRPKPLLTVAGRTLLDHAIDRLVGAGIKTAVVNSHYLGEMIAEGLSNRCDIEIIVSPEQELLDTGGGIRQALCHFDAQPFIVANADILWLDGKGSAVRRLIAAWDSARMDALLLMVPIDAAHGYDGKGDFSIDGAGRLVRRPGNGVAPLVFAGVHITTPALFAETPSGPFSTNLVWDRALARGRLYGLIHDGEWFHVGTPEALDNTNAIILRSIILLIRDDQ